MHRWRLPAWLLAALVLSACAEPPNKEMDQAQGAIDTARAAGADRYAAAEYAAAADALKQSHDAVAAGDYRLALNHALESSERAQSAAREAADTRARLRGDVERSLALVAPLLADATDRLQAAEKARVPPALLRDPAGAIAAANTDVQKAGEAMRADDYLAARQALTDTRQRIEQAIGAIAAAGTQSRRRRR